MANGAAGRPAYQHQHNQDWEPGDEVVGGWSLERRLWMNDRFADRLERAFAAGLEKRSGDETPQPRMRLAGNGGTHCARYGCDRTFIPRQIGAKYCSQRCCQLAYLQRRRGYP